MEPLEFQGFCIRVETSDVAKLLELTTHHLTYEGLALVSSYNEKGNLILTSGQVEAKVVVTADASSDVSSIRLVHKKGDFLEFLSLQKKFNLAVREACDRP